MPEDIFRWAIAGGVAVATLCILMMAVVSILLYRMVSRVQSRVDDVTMRVEPIIDSVRKLTDENGPKITAIASNAVEISDNAKEISIVAKDQAHRFAEVGRDIADRTKAQIARVDAVMDDTVDRVYQAGDNVKAAVSKPVREATAVLAGVRAAVSTLANGRRPTVDHVTQDEEMFI
jgi:methyl-accepting chemotaxis protein